jgi:membrane protease YdiL (CAAX protease family)
MSEGSVNRRLLVVGGLFYGVLAVAIVLVAVLLPDLFGFRILPMETGKFFFSLLSGLLAGVGIVGISWLLVVYTSSGRQLARKMAEAVGRLRLVEALLLSLMAGVVEEAFFRGSLWTLVDHFVGPWPALAVTSVLFGFAHGAFRKGLGLWGAFALLSGLVAGGLRIWTGAILAPVVMHVLIDAVNLPLIVRYFSVSDGQPSRFQ